MCVGGRFSTLDDSQASVYCTCSRCGRGILFLFFFFFRSSDSFFLRDGMIQTEYCLKEMKPTITNLASHL